MAKQQDLVELSTRGALVAIALGVIVIAILVGTALFRGGDLGNKLPSKGKYQAIFLANGTTFFGHLSGLGNSYVTISDAYRIQQNNQTPAPGATPGPQLSLVDTEKSLEGPEDTVQIASSQILFWENLKDDSQVVQAIKSKK